LFAQITTNAFAHETARHNHYTRSHLDIRELCTKRISLLISLIGLRHSYNIFKKFVLAPLIVGYPPSKEQTEITEQESSPTNNSNMYDPRFTEYLFVGLSENDSVTTEISLYSILRGVAKTIGLPILSTISGNILHSIFESLKYSSLASSSITMSRLLTTCSRFDKFTWSVLGGCTLALFKDLSILMYNRQRRLQRTKLRILNYKPVCGD
jgi:hypothetical protein